MGEGDSELGQQEQREQVERKERPRSEREWVWHWREPSTLNVLSSVWQAIILCGVSLMKPRYREIPLCSIVGGDGWAGAGGGVSVLNWPPHLSQASIYTRLLPHVLCTQPTHNSSILFTPHLNTTNNIFPLIQGHNYLTNPHLVTEQANTWSW